VGGPIPEPPTGAHPWRRQLQRRSHWWWSMPAGSCTCRAAYAQRINGRVPAGPAPERPASGTQPWDLSEVRTVESLGMVLRQLRRRHARRAGGAQLSYRELAAATGWSHGVIGGYLAGTVLPPTDRFDVLIRLLGASPTEQGALATARDRVEESRRRGMAHDEPDPDLPESALPDADLPDAVLADAVLPDAARPDLAAPGAELPGSGLPVPRQLPAAVFGFTGRVAALTAMDTLMAESRQAATGLICTVSGTAGVGKTALTLRWAHQIADCFPDGQLYMDLRGYDTEPPVSPTDALAGLLRSLGLAGGEIPNDMAERAATYRSLLAGRRILVVLDNAYAPEQVRPLLPGTPSCVVVVTSRDALAGLVARDGARRIDLDVLTDTDAIALLRTLIGPRVDTEPAAARALADRCARLPLALRVAAELVTADPARPIADLVAELGIEQRGLDLLDDRGDPRTAVRAVFSWSYRHLSPASARAFGLLALHPGRDIDIYALAALADSGLQEARAVIGELTRAHLVERSGITSYLIHDLLRAYAVETADVASARHAALTRLFDYLLRASIMATDTLFPYDRHNTPDAGPARTPMPDLRRPEDAMRWLDQQRQNLVAVALHASRHGWPQHSIDLSRALYRHFEVGGHYQDALAVHSGAARHEANGAEAVLANLGATYFWLGSQHEAQDCFERSLAGHRGTGDRDGEARALGRLGLVHERLGDYRQALEHMRDALASYRRIGNRHGEGTQLVNIGALYRRLGRYEEATQYQRDAATVFRALGDRRLEGYALGNLGAVESLLGRHWDAVHHLEQALANCREANDRGGEGSALGTLGAIYRRLGRLTQAVEHLQQALVISRETADRSLESETLNAIGATLRDLRQPAPALAHYRAALALTQRTGDRQENANALNGIAEVLEGANQLDIAHGYWRRAHAIYVELGLPEADTLRSRLGGAARRVIGTLDDESGQQG
jgi:tetratricopeptide (TPR) repeat protein